MKEIMSSDVSIIVYPVICEMQNLTISKWTFIVSIMKTYVFNINRQNTYCISLTGSILCSSNSNLLHHDVDNTLYILLLPLLLLLFDSCILCPSSINCSIL